MARSRPFKRDRYSFLSVTGTSDQEGTLIRRFKDQCKQSGVSVKDAVIELIARFLDG